MGYRRFGETIVLRLNRGEEIISTIREVCEKEDVKAAYIVGIGATAYAKVGAGDELQNNYQTTEYRTKMEIANLTGDIVTLKGRINPHIHVVLAETGGAVLHGGHLEEGTIFSTCEIFIHILPGEIAKREYPEQHEGWWFMDL